MEHCQPAIEQIYIEKPGKKFHMASLVENSTREMESCKNLSDGAGRDTPDMEGEQETSKPRDAADCLKPPVNVSDNDNPGCGDEKAVPVLDDADDKDYSSRDARTGPARPASCDGVKRTVEVVGSLTDGKLSGEVVEEWLSHPAVIVVCYFLACVQSVTGLDVLTAFGVLLTVVSFVSLILF